MKAAAGNTTRSGGSADVAITSSARTAATSTLADIGHYVCVWRCALPVHADTAVAGVHGVVLRGVAILVQRCPFSMSLSQSLNSGTCGGIRRSGYGGSVRRIDKE